MIKSRYNLLQDFPEPDELMPHEFRSEVLPIYKVNGHIHTPFSFSAFSSFDQMFRMAKNEKIRVLGINDFYTTAGFEPFYNYCLKYRIFPLFNVEFIGLSAEDQRKGIRINDPSNPGRIYLSGKGLNYPVTLGEQNLARIDRVINENHKQIARMIDKTNRLLESLHPTFQLSMNEIKDNYAIEFLRERHVAKAIRIMLHEKIQDKSERLDFLKKMYRGKEPEADPGSIAALENEIRANLLKAGGASFVPENRKAFLPVEQVIQIILDGGGIPCYPVLLDDINGKFTDLEKDWDNLVDRLAGYQISCIELIPGRNNFHVVKDFISFFSQHKFVILFGTEHNTPDLLPLTVSCRNGIPLDEGMKRISYEGACMIAAHQYLKAKGKSGLMGADVSAGILKKEKFIAMGNAVIEKFITP